jgi:hypothetical protein
MSPATKAAESAAGVPTGDFTDANMPAPGGGFSQ